jgi:hypothetical protein
MPRTPPDKKSHPSKAQPAPAAPRPARASQPPRVAFPKKNQQPTPAAFTARLPLALGKRFEAARTFLLKQKEVVEDVCFYGPSTGWALRYLCGGRPLCALLLHSDLPVAIVSLAATANAAVDWQALSPVGQRAQKAAHGSPSQLWLDIPLAGTGAADFKLIIRAKLANMAP